MFSNISDVSEVYFKCFMRMLQKNRSGYCICCNGCTRMIQAYVPNVSPDFSDVHCKRVYFDVTYALHICCKFFIWMLSMFYSASDACSKCFICL
jgi:hypothetical protein